MDSAIICVRSFFLIRWLVLISGRNSSTEEDHARLLALAAAGLAVGALAGLVGTAFHLALDAAERFRASMLDWAHGSPAVGWLVPILLAAAAAFVARWLVRRYAPEASGSGVQRVEEIIRGDVVPMRAAVLPVKFIGGVLALGTGMALGREGPTVQMGATIGDLCWRVFKLRAGDARVLLAAGAGAGLAAAFNAPLAGAIFVFEELLRRFELRVAVATFAACSAALAVMRSLIGDRLVFSVPTIEVELFPGYLMFLVLGIVMGALGIAYNRMIVAGLDLADRVRRVPPEIPAAIIGGVVGLLAWLWPNVVGRRRVPGAGSARRGPLFRSAWIPSRGATLARAALLCTRASRRFVRAAACRGCRGGHVVRHGGRNADSCNHDASVGICRGRYGRAVRWSRACADDRRCLGGRNDGGDQSVRAAPDRVRERHRGSLYAGQPTNLRYSAGARCRTAQG